MVLSQLGYNNLKLLTTELSYNQNKLNTKNAELEKSDANVNAFIAEFIKKIK